MGQKVSPIGMRVGINRDWHSRWFANNQEFHTFLLEDVKIRQYVTKNLKDALVSHVEIARRKSIEKGAQVRVMIFVARPGVVVGQNGANVDKIKKDIVKIVGHDNVRIDAIEVKNPDLDATLIAQWIATELENRASFRTAQKKAIQRVRKAGAKGCKTMISGRLGGADIARSEGYKEGVVPLTTLKANIDYAHAEAVTTYGRLGVKVWICRGDKALEEKPQPKADRKGAR